jgi:hypothetical protein
MDEELYRVMIESIEPETSFFQVFWTPARHPGQAIESVLRACLRLGLRNPVARELDYLDLDSVPDESFHDEESNVFHTNVRISFPTQKTFVAPFGIIGSGEKGEHDYELIREGFCLTKTEANIYEVEVVIERDSLLNTFLELVKKLPSIRVFIHTRHYWY